MKSSEYKSLSKEERSKVKFIDLPVQNKFGCFTFLIVIVAIFFFMFGPKSGSPTPEDAYNVSKEFIKGQLLDPKSAEFIDERKQIANESSNVYIIIGVVKATNRIGTKPPQEYRMKVRYQGDGYNGNKDNWQMLELEFNK